MTQRTFIAPLAIVVMAIAIALTLHSCANRGYLEGGTKDETPPKVIKESPESYSTNFDKKYVNIYFDEFIQLKDVNNKFIISPPQNKKPKVRLKGKYVQVEFVDTLRPNVTYSLDFADAIVDNNEGNPLGFYRYVFSTGNTIDSLELSGQVVNGESLLPVLNAYVLLYTTNTDSLPITTIPDYIARTDSSGYFKATNLREADYKIVAIMDENRDYKYVPEGEMIGYIDSLVHPVVFDMTRVDTITRIEKIVGRDTLVSDSIVRHEYLAYGPSNLYIKLFQEESTQLYMTNDERKDRHKLDFTFSVPAEDNGLSVEFLNAPNNEDTFLVERNAGNDTLTYWIRDSLVYKIDSLQAVVKYLRTDSTGQRVYHSDTSRFLFKDKVVKEKKGRDKDKDKDKEEEVKIEFININSNLGGNLDIKAPIKLTFTEPIDSEGLNNIKLYEVIDSTLNPLNYTLTSDSLKIREFSVFANMQAGKNYKIEIDSATVYNIYGKYNNKFEKTFKIKEEKEYGKLIMNMTGVEGPTLLQLFKSENAKADNGKVKFNVVQEKWITKDEKVVFEYLQAGKYKLRAISDLNGNKKWDTGRYLSHIQPEPIYYIPTELNIKENFDVEQDLDLSGAK
ncbi:MAG: Ig-like domain-containing protein [Marinifilaceae bacterium]